MSASWFLELTYLIWILGSILIPSNNQSKATLWIEDTRLLVGLRPLIYHFDHGFATFKDVQLGFIVRRMCVAVHTSTSLN